MEGFECNGQLVSWRNLAAATRPPTCLVLASCGGGWEGVWRQQGLHGEDVLNSVAFVSFITQGLHGEDWAAAAPALRGG